MNIIAECQDALDRYAAYIGIGATNAYTGEGKPGSGDRAANVKKIPEAEWEAGRQIRRTKEINSLLSELRRRAVSYKTKKDDTKLGYLLREDYRGYHERWPGSGIVRGDGTIDPSQIRMVMANSIKGRGFSRVQFIALMSYFFGHECYQKWKNKERVQEELATLWFKARGPRADEYKPIPVQPAPRGRAREHSELVEAAYEALVSFKAGTEAILTTQDLADALGVVRRTACTLLYELTKAGRIVYRSARWNSGIIVGFPQEGVIIDQKGSGDIEHKEYTNGHRPSEPITADKSDGVIIEKDSMTVLQHKHAENDIPDSSEITATSDPHIYIYNHSIYPVSLAKQTCTPRNRVTIDQAVEEAYENLPRDRLVKGGELKKWPITSKRIREYITEHYADCGWKREAIDERIGRVRAKRRARTFDELKGLRREVVEKRLSTTRKRIEAAERKAVTHEVPDAREWYQKRAAQLQGQLGLLGWELGRREIELEGYTSAEQQEMLDLVAETRGQHNAAEMIDRLKALKVKRE